MVLVIDNYDSFTYNLVQYLGILGQQIEVVRNDQISVEELEKLEDIKIVISPGPGTPNDSGICLETIARLSGKVPILGVCLGHQCIGQVFGIPVVRGREPVHGKTSTLTHTGEGIFAGIPQGFRVARYHSLILQHGCETDDLRITARTPEGVIMAIAHKTHPTFGVQFHPESIATEYGLEVLQNFLRIC